MGEIKVTENGIAVPGEVLAQGMDFIPSQGTYRSGENIRAKQLGMVKVEGKVIKLMPLSGRYVPKRDDIIICEVIDVLMSGWRVETNTAYTAMLPLKDASSEYIAKGADLTRFFALGDYIMCAITNVTSQKLIDISMKGPGLRKLEGGRIFEVNPHKVPRIIGKEGSMISMIKHATGCQIMVGQNGIVWLKGEPEAESVAYEVVRKIEKEATIPGLTDRVKALLEKKMKVKIESPSEAQNIAPRETETGAMGSSPQEAGYERQGGNTQGEQRYERPRYERPRDSRDHRRR